jgi:hypothetical protein
MLAIVRLERIRNLSKWKVACFFLVVKVEEEYRFKWRDENQ